VVIVLGYIGQVHWYDAWYMEKWSKMVNERYKLFKHWNSSECAGKKHQKAENLNNLIHSICCHCFHSILKVEDTTTRPWFGIWSWTIHTPMCPLSKVIKRKSAYDMASNEIHKLIEQIPHMVWARDWSGRCNVGA